MHLEPRHVCSFYLLSFFFTNVYLSVLDNIRWRPPRQLDPAANHHHQPPSSGTATASHTWITTTTPGKGSSSSSTCHVTCQWTTTITITPRQGLEQRQEQNEEQRTYRVRDAVSWALVRLFLLFFLTIKILYIIGYRLHVLQELRERWPPTLQLPYNFKFHDSLDSFKAFYVNKYIDYIMLMR